MTTEAPGATAAPESSKTPCPTTNAAGKRICCACPETREARDRCVLENGEDACQEVIRTHLACLRKEGFNV